MPRRPVAPSRSVVGQPTETGRLGIVAVGLFFVLGMVLLSGVDVEAGRRAALEEERNLGPLEPVPAVPDGV